MTNNHTQLLSEAFNALKTHHKTVRNDFAIECNKCHETSFFVDFSNAQVGDIGLSIDNNEINLFCKCGNRIRIV